MTEANLVAAVLIGVLLPAVFSRPRFLAEHPMRDHVRRRWNYAYSAGVFASIGYVYVSAVYLLRPTHALSAQSRHALSGGALILLLIACAHHLPPLIAASRSQMAKVVVTASSLVLGTTAGGFFAIDQVFADARHPVMAYVAWGILLLLFTVVTYWFSGLSPETQLALYTRKRRRSTSRRRRGAAEPG